jgi:hypothetical protein
VPDSACGQPELGAFKPACLPRPAPKDSRYPPPPSSAVPPGTVEPATAAFPVGLLAGIPAERCRAAGSRPDQPGTGPGRAACLHGHRGPGPQLSSA